MEKCGDKSCHRQIQQAGDVAWHVFQQNRYCEISAGLNRLQVFPDLSSWLESKV